MYPVQTNIFQISPQCQAVAKEVKPRPSPSPDPAAPGSSSLWAVSTGIVKVTAWVIEEYVYFQAFT